MVGKAVVFLASLALALLLLVAGCEKADFQEMKAWEARCADLQLQDSAKEFCYAYFLSLDKPVRFESYCGNIKLPTLQTYCLLKQAGGRENLNVKLFDYCTGSGFEADGIEFDRSSAEALGFGDLSDGKIQAFREDICGRFNCTEVVSYPCGAGKTPSVTPYAEYLKSRGHG